MPLQLRLRLDALRELVAQSRISQNHWAIRLGLSRGHWSDLLNGRHPYPSQRTRLRLLETFGVEEAALFERDGDASIPEESLVRRALAVRYEILEELGRGATGVVLAAQHRRLGRLVAIKIVQAEAVAGVGTTQLLSELGTTSKLTHPNILPLFDADVEHGHPYLILPLVRGGSLRALLEARARLPLDEVVSLIDGVSRALAYAHSRQLLHSDVKPENILVEDGHPYLMDFGIARRLESEADEWSGLRESVGYSAGTPAYVSPEQAAGEAVDQRSDIYSLACVAYEMLSGRLPFEGRSTQEVVARRFHTPAPPLRDYAPDVPQAVADVIARAMEVAPNRRPDTALAFAQELRRAASARSLLGGAVTVAIGRAATRLRSRLGIAGPARLRLPLSGVLQQMQQTIRSLRRDWQFSLNIIVSLGLGLGVGLPAISLADHVFLRPPPMVQEPERVVRLVKRMWPNGELYGTSMTGLDYSNAAEMRTLTTVAAVFSWTTESGSGGDAVPIAVDLVSASYFDVLGVRPHLGRFFLADEDRDGAAPDPVVVSYVYWQRNLGGAPDVLGRTLEIAGTRFTIVGVTPKDFNGIDLAQRDAFLPFHTVGRRVGGDAPDLFTSDGTAWIRIIGRLAPEASTDAAASEATALYRRPGTFRRDQERRHEMLVESIIPGRSLQTPRYARISLWTSIGAFLLLALITANLVSLFVARAAAVARQTAIRIALGARVRQLWRDAMTEAVTLALAGSALGLAIAAPLTSVARALVIPTLVWTRPTFDLRLVGIALGVAVAAATIAAAFALGYAARVEPAELMRSSGSARSGGQRGVGILRATMIVLQATVFGLLLSLSTGFVVSVRQVANWDNGFNPDSLAFVDIPVTGVSADEQRQRVTRVAEALRAVPGVAVVSQAYTIPWWNNSNFRLIVPGSDDTTRYANFDNASPEHAEAMGFKMLDGRWIGPQDQFGTELVIVVNETLARKVWGAERAIGKCIKFDDQSAPCRTVIGVVASSSIQGAIDRPFEAAGTIPYTQAASHRRPGSVFVRGTATAEQIRLAVKAFDPNLPRARVTLMREHMAGMSRNYEIGRSTFTLFGALSAVIALIGLGGVLAYLVAQERTAFAVRLALGSPTAQLVRPVLLRAAWLVGCGLAMSVLLLALLRSRVNDILFHTDILNPTILASVTGAGITLALLAAWIPLRTVMRLQPMQVLREE